MATRKHTDRTLIPVTYEMAMAAGRDAANANAAKHGRSSWSRVDYNVACRTFNKLFNARSAALN